MTGVPHAMQDGMLPCFVHFVATDAIGESKDCMIHWIAISADMLRLKYEGLNVEKGIAFRVRA